MKHPIPLLLLCCALAGGVNAATYQSVLTQQSSISFRYQQMGVAMDGKFNKFTAQIQLDPTKPEQAQGSIDIELASIDTGSSEADEEVVGKSWFHVAAHPKARFVLRQLQPVGANQYEARGLLTLKGNSRELRAPLKLSPHGVLSGSFVLKRGDFGIGEGIWSKFDVVANEITVFLTSTSND